MYHFPINRSGRESDVLLPVVEPVDETSDEPFEGGRAEGRTQFRRRVGRSLPGAVAGVMLISAIAFGAGAVHAPDASSTGAGAAAQAGGAAAGGDPSVGHAAGGDIATGTGGTPAQAGTDEHAGTGPTDADSSPEHHAGTATSGDGGADTGDGAEPTSKPDPADGASGSGAGNDGSEPTTRPEPTSKPDPTPVSNPETLGLVASVTDGGDVRLDWTACGDGAAAYKVVRSTDGSATWPYGSGDRQIALIKADGATAYTDADAPAGRTLVYRVFCVGGHDGAWVLVALTPGRVVHTPASDPAPTPEPTAPAQTMSLGLSSSDSGGVYIGWSACSADGFSYYKVVRSPDEQVRWPLGDNDTLVAYIGDRTVTHFVDHDVAPGGAYFYRVFCVHAAGDGYATLDSTTVHDFHVPAVDPTRDPTPTDAPTAPAG